MTRLKRPPNDFNTVANSYNGTAAMVASYLYLRHSVLAETLIALGA
jgi:hypothetical protein